MSYFKAAWDGFYQAFRDMGTIIAWFLAWFFWAAGHLSYLILTLFEDHQWWVDLWFPAYSDNMIRSGNVQDWARGNGRWWPWGEQAAPEE